MISVILAGGGRGKRINNTPKAFIKIGGKELLYHCLEKFCKMAYEIVVVLPAGYEERWEEKLRKSYRNVRVVAGGTERQDSVKSGIDFLKNRSGITIVHDIARPFFTNAMLRRLIEGATKYGACIPYIELQDTVKEVDGLFVRGTPDRQKMVQIQTPQVFKTTLLRNAYLKAFKEKFYGSDDSVLVERTGARVYLVRGSRENMKLTYPEDLLLARNIFKNRKE